MFIVENYTFSVFLCFITMLCWGSWANAQNFLRNFGLYFIEDYAIGVLLFSFLMISLVCSFGESGRPLFEDLIQANSESYLNAFLGGVVFNLANLIIVAAISMWNVCSFSNRYGYSTYFRCFVNYVSTPIGNLYYLFLEVFLIVLAILIDAVAYKFHLGGKTTSSYRGIVISLIGGIWDCFIGLLPLQCHLNLIILKMVYLHHIVHY